jgi:tetratricopeptide (TPR) repeat protein
MELEDARRCADEARSLAIDAALGRELGEASALLGMVAHAQGSWHEVFRAEFVESLRDRPTLAPYVLDAHLCLAEFSLDGPSGHEEIEPFARSLLDIANDAGSVRGQAMALLMLGEVQLFTGRLGEAASTLARSAQLNKAGHATSALSLALIRSGETEIARGRRWQASRLLDRAITLAEDAPLASHLIIRAHAARVLATKANDRVSALDKAERAVTTSVGCQPCSIGFHVTASTIRARSGDLKAAHRHLETAERIAGMWQGGPWKAAVWEARGVLRIAEGDRIQGAALLTEAAELFAHSGRTLDAARCQASTS